MLFKERIDTSNLGLEKVTPALVKAASEEDMKCLFESRLKTSIAAAEKGVLFIMLATNNIRAVGGVFLCLFLSN